MQSWRNRFCKIGSSSPQSVDRTGLAHESFSIEEASESKASAQSGTLGDLAAAVGVGIVGRVWADYVGSLTNRVFVDPASLSVHCGRLPERRRFDANSVETTPADTGSDAGHAAWMTFYIPRGDLVDGRRAGIRPTSRRPTSYAAVGAEDTTRAMTAMASTGISSAMCTRQERRSSAKAMTTKWSRTRESSLAQILLDGTWRRLDGPHPDRAADQSCRCLEPVGSPTPRRFRHSGLVVGQWRHAETLPWSARITADVGRVGSMVAGATPGTRTTTIRVVQPRKLPTT